jgi:hypothetical protein
VQFTAGEEYVKLIEEAQALLSHSAPRATLDEIQLRAMRALVAELKRRKHTVTARPQSHAEPKVEVKRPQSDIEPGRSQVESEHTRRRRRRGRHVPAAVRRAVFERDEARCTFTDPSGRRCGEIGRAAEIRALELRQRAMPYQNTTAWSSGGIYKSASSQGNR